MTYSHFKAVPTRDIRHDLNWRQPTHNSKLSGLFVFCRIGKWMYFPVWTVALYLLMRLPESSVTMWTIISQYMIYPRAWWNPILNDLLTEVYLGVVSIWLHKEKQNDIVLALFAKIRPNVWSLFVSIISLVINYQAMSWFHWRFSLADTAHSKCRSNYTLKVYVLTSPWTSCQIRKIAGCACAGNAGNVFPATDFKGNRMLAIPACITARASCTCRDACRDR